MTRIRLDGHTYDLTPLAVFRQQHGLPPTFSVPLFEPKDASGLGRLDQGSVALHELRATVLGAIPAALTLSALMDFVPQLSNLFRVKLYEVNDAIGLRPVEVDFAAAGFEDVCQALVYAHVAARAGRAQVDFEQVYTAWLDGTTRAAAHPYPYTHGDAAWQVYTLHNAYGRLGLRVVMPTGTHHIEDTGLSCPAQGYMRGLLAAVAGGISAALG